MIRKFPCKSIPASWPPHAARTFSYAAALVVLVASSMPTTDAFGQTGFLTRDPNVSVDMSVLEELGPPSTVASQLLSSGNIPRPALSFPPPTAPVSRLTGPLAARRFNLDPLARPQTLAPPRSRLTRPLPAAVRPPAPVAAAPVTPERAAPAPRTPAPAQVEVRSARPATPVPPAPTPPPTPAVAAPAPAPPPAAAPKEDVDVAPPPPPPSATAAAPPAPAPVEEPEPPAPAPAPARVATPPLTPSPAGPAPAPPAETAPAPPVQTASAPPVSGQEPSFRVLFDNGSAKISDAARGPLEELSNKMKESEDLRVQLLAYAGGTSETASQARRLSLSRALAVRSFLIGQGVRSTRMDVRALGNKAESGPADRVDAVLVER